jgi:hypothetical protein
LTGSTTKTYDRTTDAILTGANYSLSGVISGDSVALNNPVSGIFDNMNAGTNKTVSVSGLAINNSNYVLGSTSASAAIGQIDAKTLTAALTGSTTKTYDRTTDATLTGANYSLSGVISGDSVALNNPVSGIFDNMNAGTNKTVSVSGLAINNSNYVLGSTSESAAIGQIDAKQLAVIADNAEKRASAADPVLFYTYTGLVSGDSMASFTGQIARQPGTAPGVYNIGQNTLAATGNYSIGSFTTGLFTIQASNLPDTVVRRSSLGMSEQLESQSFSGYQASNNGYQLTSNSPIIEVKPSIFGLKSDYLQRQDNLAELKTDAGNASLIEEKPEQEKQTSGILAELAKKINAMVGF